MSVRISALLALILPLAACVSTPEAPMAPAAPVGGEPRFDVSGMPPLDPALGPIRLAEQGCLRAVAQTAGTAQVAIVNGDFSDSGTVYQITAGPNSQVWRCTGFGDGSTAEVAPLV
jgi:hypothetical protein